MAQDTKIQWTDSTINGSSGCDGCELWAGSVRACYAGQIHENRLARSYPEKYAPSFSEVRMIPGRYAQAAAFPDLTGKPRKGKPWLDGKPRHIFVGDMGDFLSDAVTDGFLERELLAAITSPNGSRHIWQLLTKRPDRLADLSEKWGGLPDNVVAMTTTTNQRTWDLRIPQLLRVRCKTRGVSAEPMLGPIEPDLVGLLQDAQDGSPMLHWLICGGESGHKARPMEIEWARTLRNETQAAGLAFFMKQLGGTKSHRGEYSDFPADLRIRRMPLP